MKNFIRYIFLLFFFFGVFSANANNFAGYSVIENANIKTEYITNKQNESLLEILKEQNNIFIKNENNEEVSVFNNQKNSSSSKCPINIHNNDLFINNLFSYKLNDFCCLISYNISPILKYSIQKRAP